MAELVLSLFPGIGLLDRAFEESGYCVVRGPDLLWGGDVRAFHPPAGAFDGVIGGPPCQAHSRLANLVRHVHGPEKVAEDLIPEFLRCVREASPRWWLMEMVPEGPVPGVEGYQVHAQLLRDVWVGGETTRLRRFSFGTRDGRRLTIQCEALFRTDPSPAVLASGGRSPERLRGSSVGNKNAHLMGYKTASYLRHAILAQGLPEGFDLPGMTVAGKIKAIGNGVPLAMGRAVAQAVRLALEGGA